ncbi:hypothetical protein [Halobacillus sp. A5]|uniref:hypothetical protein n=1 Tax=Halobacillus sp. A5 TaxID=2880263 RepID=UPI0020A6B448|nr:hypothetical protein [Halobacillus sp. A5]MCP3027691.1 hypothetical protein [Halobacillus sp. A5]
MKRKNSAEPVFSRKTDKFFMITGVIIGVTVSRYGADWGLSIVEELLLLLGVMIFFITIYKAAGKWWRNK